MPSLKKGGEATALASDTTLGLGASLRTRDFSAARNYTPRIEAGTVLVNSHVFIDPNMQFGGFKQSGIGSDFDVEWLDTYTEISSFCIAV